MKYFLKRSLFLYFRKKEPRKSSLLFQKVTFRAPKCFLCFKKWKFSIPSLKTLVLFLGVPLRVFHYCFLRCFISPLIFTIVFGCFHCWLHLFTSVSSLPWLFLSGTSFLCCYTAKATGGFYFTLLPDIWCNVGCSNNTIAPTCFPGRKQFRFEDYRASHWCSKQRPGPSVCLNHTVFSKRY